MLTIKDGYIQDKEILGVPVKVLPISVNTGRCRPRIAMVPWHTVYHDTANKNVGANARMHQRYVQNHENDPKGAQISYHFAVDDKEIIQLIPLNEVAWCQGDGNGNGNMHGISVEQCINADGDAGKAEDNACKLHGALLATYPSMRLTKHQDWTGKWCPGQILNRGAWGSTVSEIMKYKESLTKPRTAIMYERRTNVEQMKQWAINRKADPLFIELAPIFYEISASNNVDPAVVYTQSAHETNFMKFGGVIDKSFKNPCGMKTKDGGGNYEKEAHQRFKSWEEGITAQVHHLALYYGHKDYPKANSPDPRHFASIHGKAKTVEQLTGNWATNPNYAKEILKFMDELQKTKVDTVSVGDTELHVEIDTCVCYAQDGDLPNAIALVNALGQGTVLVKGDPWFSARAIIQVGGHEVKGATVKIVGENRAETLIKVAEFLEKEKGDR